MNPTQLLQQFGILAETPDAVAKLRNLVLRLAVQGRLGTQVGGEKIAASVREILPQSEPFAAPENWRWTQFGEVAIIAGGFAFKSGDYATSGVFVLRVTNIEPSGRVTKTDAVFLPEERIGKEIQKFYLDAGDILLVMVGGSLGKIGVVTKNVLPALLNQNLWRITPANKDVDNGFLKLLTDFTVSFQRKITHSTHGHLSREEFRGKPVALPPLAEQRRIVAKVEELLALCDELEARQTAAREHRTRLVRSSLDHLTTVKTEPEFRQHAAFVLQNADLVLDSVSDLREAILSLAVQGHVVPNKLGDTEIREIKFEEIIEDSRYGTAKKCHYQNEGTAVLRIPNVVSGKIDLSNLKRTELTKREKADLSLQKGDLLIVRSNGSLSLVGRSAVVTEECTGSAFAGYLVRVRLRLAEADPGFVQLALSSSQIRQQIEMPIRTTSGVKNINTQEIYRLTFPLPPLAEQKQIVAKVDELMRWCDALEARLTAAQTAATALLDATLHQILAV